MSSKPTVSKQDSIFEGLSEGLQKTTSFLMVLCGGWGLEDIPAMLENAGERQSNLSGCGSDAEWADPVWKGGTKRGQIELDEKEMEKWPKWVRRAKRRLLPLLGALIKLSKSVKDGDVVVIFGRDMYPVQAILPVWSKFLSGTWIYVEGASRPVLEDNWFQAGLARLIKKHLRPQGMVWGVDTGFTGSVPDTLIRDNHYMGQDTYLHDWYYSCFLVSADWSRRRAYDHMDLSPDRWSKSRIRKEVLALERYPKPFMRATEVNTETNWPLLRLAKRSHILKAAAMMVAAQEEAVRIREELPSLFSGSQSADYAYRQIEVDQDKDESGPEIETVPHPKH